MKYSFLLIYSIFCSFFATSVTPSVTPVDEIKHVDSVTKIKHVDSVTKIKHAFGPNMVLVCDADETIGQVDCMLLNYENRRQHLEAMMQVAMEFYKLANGKGESAAEEFAIDEFTAFFKPLYEVFGSALLSYSLTEDEWVPFLAAAREAGAQVIIISSRRFFRDGADEETARIKFFTDLGFAREHLLYSGKADDYKKDITLRGWLVGKPEITEVVFVDNLHTHGEEIMESEHLREYARKAFVHNAYLRYFERHYQTILLRQLHAAFYDKKRLTDAEALLCKDAKEE